MHNGTTHQACAFDEKSANRGWCPIKLTDAGNLGAWGDCGPSCPMPKGREKKCDKQCQLEGKKLLKNICQFQAVKILSQEWFHFGGNNASYFITGHLILRTHKLILNNAQKGTIRNIVNKKMQNEHVLLKIILLET
jgi:hypothetical protein